MYNGLFEAVHIFAHIQFFLFCINKQFGAEFVASENANFFYLAKNSPFFFFFQSFLLLHFYGIRMKGNSKIEKIARNKIAN